MNWSTPVNKLGKRGGGELPKWIIALLFVIALSIVGIGVSLFVRTFIPFWILFGFSIIFSVEKWFSLYTRKYKWISKIYRLVLNLSILSLLILLIWSGIRLFSGQFNGNALVGIFIFLEEFIAFVWLWKVISKNSWRWPSMKLTMFSLICLYMVFAFAGVQPMATYKDRAFSNISSILSSPPTASSSNSATPPVTKPESIQPTILPAITPGAVSAIDRSAFQAIDQYALGTPESAAKSLDSLAAYLVKPAKNDFEKARAIYRWITQNISYDFSAYLTKSYGSTHAVDVLTSRSSVCAGYSGLFYYLARSAKLEVVSISGWAKGYGYNAGDQINGRTNHEWNAVKINGGWYLIDSTWGAGYIEEQRFVREFDEAYFLTPPDQFIFNHLPEDSKWQLLNKPLTQNDFSVLPYVNQNFFKYGLNLGNNTQSVINAKDSLNMTFPVQNDTYLMAGLSHGNFKLAESFAVARRVGNQYQINATFPYPGTYVLSIFARKNGEYGTYSGVLEYKVIAGSTSSIK